MMPSSPLEAFGLALLIVAATPSLILAISCVWRFCSSFVREVRRLNRLYGAATHAVAGDGRLEVLFEGDEFPAADCSAGERAAVLNPPPLRVVHLSPPLRCGSVRHGANVIDLNGARHSQKDNGVSQ